MRPFPPFEHVKLGGTGCDGRERADKSPSSLPKPGGTPESLAGMQSLQQTQTGQIEDHITDTETNHQVTLNT